jgi:hypothetical protein
MPALNDRQLKYFHMAKLLKEGKISLPKKDLHTFVKCIKELTDPRFRGMTDPRTDLRYDVTGANSAGKSPQEPMTLEFKNNVMFDTSGKPIDPHFLQQEDSTLPPDNLGRKGVAVPGSNYLDEEGDDDSSDTNVNPVAKTFKQQGNFEQYIQKFSGLEIKPKELESITNYTNAKPTKMDKFSVRYEGTDEFSNNTITVIKKLREGNDLVFTIFQVTSQQAPEGGEEANPTENEIMVNKSRSFRDEVEGGRILADMLQKLEI